MNTHYSIVWSDDDRTYIAGLPEFGAYTHTHGDSHEEAARNGCEV